jgi:hypothetical protein
VVPEADGVDDGEPGPESNGAQPSRSAAPTERTPGAYAKHAAARHLKRRERAWDRQRAALDLERGARWARLGQAHRAGPPQAVQVVLGWVCFGSGTCAALVLTGSGRGAQGAACWFAAIVGWVVAWFVLATGERRRAVAAARADLERLDADRAAFERAAADYRRRVEERVDPASVGR